MVLIWHQLMDYQCYLSDGMYSLVSPSSQKQNDHLLPLSPTTTQIPVTYNVIFYYPLLFPFLYDIKWITNPSTWRMMSGTGLFSPLTRPSFSYVLQIKPSYKFLTSWGVSCLTVSVMSCTLHQCSTTCSIPVVCWAFFWY